MVQVHLFNGDCLTYTPPISVDALISDPPYGAGIDTDYTRFTGGLSPSRNHHAGIKNDDKPFDPSPFIGFKKVVLFGSQFFGDKLPVGTKLIWVKKRDNQLGKFLSDGEEAWMKGGKGLYVFRHIWNGFDRESERGKTLHPTQKPSKLWEWVFDKLRLEPGQTVYDPFMGSGSCGVAAVKRGLNFVGCELESNYFAIAQERIEAARVDRDRA